MKINLTTLGCPKNIVDSEILLGGLKGDGAEIVDNPLDAETIILNTCGFIQGAKEESIDAILEAVELKKKGRCKKVFVTGCLSQRYQHELVREIPEVDGFYGNRDMMEILRGLLSKLDLKREHLGERVLTTPAHFAYLKISEGCENPCTFCSIPGIRGNFMSKSLESLLDEARMLAEKGVKELIIVAQDTTIYGRDLYGEKRLVPLLEGLAKLNLFKWIRLLYTYPAHFSDDIIEILSEFQHVYNYVDLPIQHISDEILRKMARKVRRSDIETLVEKLRTKMPDVTLRTTLISGFPGETDEQHRELVEYVEDAKFERLGFFTFSREEDTPAYDFSDQIPDHIKQERWAELNDVQCEVSYQLNHELLGSVREVLLDSYDQENKVFSGRTSSDCPEIDNTIRVNGNNAKVGEFTNVEITDVNEYDLEGYLKEVA